MSDGFKPCRTCKQLKPLNEFFHHTRTTQVVRSCLACRPARPSAPPASSSTPSAPSPAPLVLPPSTPAPLVLLPSTPAPASAAAPGRNTTPSPAAAALPSPPSLPPPPTLPTPVPSVTPAFVTDIVETRVSELRQLLQDDLHHAVQGLKAAIQAAVNPSTPATPPAPLPSSWRPPPPPVHRQPFQPLPVSTRPAAVTRGSLPRFGKHMGKDCPRHLNVDTTTATTASNTTGTNAKALNGTPRLQIDATASGMPSPSTAVDTPQSRDGAAWPPACAMSQSSSTRSRPDTVTFSMSRLPTAPARQRVRRHKAASSCPVTMQPAPAPLQSTAAGTSADPLLVPSADLSLVSLSALQSFRPPARPNTTMASISAWGVALADYPDKAFVDQLLGAIRHGILIGYTGPLRHGSRFSNIKNLPMDAVGAAHGLYRSHAAGQLPAVNDGIATHFTAIRYATLASILSFVRDNPGCAMSTVPPPSAGLWSPRLSTV
ncbi:hypothetical protein NDA14_007430 [Ustilago hordei]|nr:hypothetical protein NDA14_007430 [Ustilago hordei]